MVTNQIKENPYKTYIKQLNKPNRRLEKNILITEINYARYSKTLEIQERYKYKLDIIKQVELEEEMINLLIK